MEEKSVSDSTLEESAFATVFFRTHPSVDR